MVYSFDQLVERRGSSSKKWRTYEADVLAMWVADMDFQSPAPVVEALRECVEHGMYGYGLEPHGLRELIVKRMDRLYRWKLSPEEIVFMSGVVPGLNLACLALSSPGDGLLLQTPVYQRILALAEHVNRSRHEMQLTRQSSGRYGIDFDAFEAAITERTRLFVLCNPHNPVGRVFSADELARVAEVCLQHKILILSDEIHCDLLFRGHDHVPVASLDPEVAQQTVTFMAPTKTFNLAGLHCGFAIIQNAELRSRYVRACRDVVREPGITGYAATLAAYRDGQPWLDALLDYLQDNRDTLLEFVRDQLPDVDITEPEATYLAWLDCRQAAIPGNAQQFFLREARVALSDGAQYGRGGEGFVRLNFGCPRSTLLQALERMRAALVGMSNCA